jgi:hypothetical protein
MLGVLGGAAAFGLLGVFVGPTLLAVTHAVLRDWIVVKTGTPSAAPVAPLAPSTLADVDAARPPGAGPGLRHARGETQRPG